MTKYDIYKEIKSILLESSMNNEAWFDAFVQKYGNENGVFDIKCTDTIKLGVIEANLELLAVKLYADVERERRNMKKENKGSENKRLICDRLLEVLYLTRQCSDITDLDYIEDEELVIAHFEGGHSKAVNVACDSGFALILDVVNALRG